MDDTLLAITTYQRAAMCAELLRSLLPLPAGVRVVVIDDASDDDYGAVRDLCAGSFGMRYIRHAQNRGKRWYWQTVQDIITHAKDTVAEYLMQIPDDVMVCRDFCGRVQQAIDTIPTPGAWVATMHTDHIRENVSCWQSGPPVATAAPEWQSIGYTDGNVVINRAALEAIRYRIEQVRPDRWAMDPTLGSGAWRQFTIACRSAGVPMYRYHRSLVAVRDTFTVIGTQHEPHRTMNFVDTDHSGCRCSCVDRPRVTACMATYSPRVDVVPDAVLSLLPQVDRLNIYANDLDSIPDFWPRDPKIRVVLGKDAAGDLKCSAKFFWSRKIDGFVATVDDDLIYPPDYISRLMGELSQHEKTGRSVVGVHGVLINEHFDSYYRSKRTIHCLRECKKTRRVHLLGTGTLFYRSETVRITPRHFHVKNMEDIIFGIFAKRADVPLWCVARPHGWLKYNEKMGDRETIWDHFKDAGDTDQTRLIKEEMPWPQL